VLTPTKPRQCAILCILLLHSGAQLSRAHLIEALWGSDLPGDPRGALRSYIYGLRKVPGIGDRLQTHTSGYAIQLHERDILDAQVFHDLTQKAAEASRKSDHAAAAQLLDHALAMWRTPSLADLPSTPAMQPLAAELLERRNVAQEALVDARLAAGHHRDLLPALGALAAAEPLRERRWEQLMLALYRAGRQAEALDAYAQARNILTERCGLDPGPDLKLLQKRVLSNDPTLRLRPAPIAAAGPGEQGAATKGPLPPLTLQRQIPNPVHEFVGRCAELSALVAMAAQARLSQYSTNIAVISGSPGVGKSALAVQAAHQIAGYFPHGQLYTDLKGFARRGRPVQAAEALGAILDSLGIAPERIPASLEARAALYRSLLRGRRILVVADDARDSAQVHHLIPASPGCMMIVTCRRHISSLVASAGARVVNLDVMPPADAEALLLSRLKRDGVAADATAVSDLAQLCEYLPLALAIAATHTAERPAVPLAHLVSEMRQSRSRLDVLRGYEPDSDVRSAFATSYASLTPTAARVLRLISLGPKPEFTPAAVAGLARIPVCEASRALRELTHMNLAVECSPNRFYLHGLLRAFAAERLEAEGPAARVAHGHSPGG
jgi:DNA-binding SARP family transcriptional activator